MNATKGPIRRWILNGVEKRNLYFQFKYKDPSKVTEFLKSKEEFLWLLMVVMTKEEDSSLITPHYAPRPLNIEIEEKIPLMFNYVKH